MLKTVQAVLALSLMVAMPRVVIAGLSRPRVPIEVEFMQPGVLPSALGGHEFDTGLLAGLREEQLTVQSAHGASRTIAHPYNLTTERPAAKPQHVRVRIIFDGQAIYDYAPGSSPDAIQGADHWLVHVAVPFRALRLAPGAWQRMSFWARSDRPEYHENMGRVIALSVLEALNRETGRIRRDEQLLLGPDITRDPKYSEGGSDPRPGLRSSIALATPMVLMWGTALLIAIVVVRFVHMLRRRRGQ
jgi:hypothetical protein